MIMEHVKWKKKREIRTATTKWKQSVTLLTFFQILLLRTMVMVIRNNSFSILTPSHIHISKIWAYMLMLPMMWKYKNDVSALHSQWFHSKAFLIGYSIKVWLLEFKVHFWGSHSIIGRRHGRILIHHSFFGAIASFQSRYSNVLFLMLLALAVLSHRDSSLLHTASISSPLLLLDVLQSLDLNRIGTVWSLLISLDHSSPICHSVHTQFFPQDNIIAAWGQLLRTIMVPSAIFTN